MKGVFVIVVVAVLAGCGDSPPATRLPTREEFRAAVEGKTKEEVMKLLGRPVRTRELRDGAEWWIYHDKALDPTAGRPVDNQTLEFDPGGVCRKVRF